MKSELLSVAIDAVKQAEVVILKYLDEGVQAELKEDLTPVTIADKEAETTIKRVIAAKFPDHTFYGEEGEKVDLKDHKGFTWIIDPIDGTKSYIKGNPLFGTQLALLHDGELVIGVSNAPLLKELMYAEKGQGCYLNDKPVHVSDTTELGQAYLSFGSIKRFTKHGNLQPLLDLNEKTRWARGIGDFWSYHLVAQGKIDIMAEAELALWDIAAAKVIVEEAGGTLTQLDGTAVNPTTMNAVATNGKLHDQVVSIFAS